MTHQKCTHHSNDTTEAKTVIVLREIQSQRFDDYCLRRRQSTSTLYMLIIVTSVTGNSTVSATSP